MSYSKLNEIFNKYKKYYSQSIDSYNGYFAGSQYKRFTKANFDSLVKYINKEEQDFEKTKGEDRVYAVNVKNEYNRIIKEYYSSSSSSDISYDDISFRKMMIKDLIILFEKAKAFEVCKTKYSKYINQIYDNYDDLDKEVKILKERLSDDIRKAEEICNYIDRTTGLYSSMHKDLSWYSQQMITKYALHCTAETNPETFEQFWDNNRRLW